MKQYGVLRSGFVMAVLLATAGIAGLEARPYSRDLTVVIIPARYRVIQLAADLAYLRPSMVLLSYQTLPGSTEPILHRWEQSDWHPVAFDAFREKKFMQGLPKTVIVVGNESEVPPAIPQAISWCADIQRLPTLAIAELLNGFDPYLKFKESEWQWLAGRYNLNLTDVNAARRAFNPYDIPRSKALNEFNRQDHQEPAPAAVVESPPSPVSEDADKANREPASH